MKRLTRFESNLIHLLHFFLKQAPIQQAQPLLEAKINAPNSLSMDCLDLIKDCLSKGIVALLVQSGSWRKEKFLRDEKQKEGRLWDRTDPKDLGLLFTKNTLDFLIWITEQKPEGKKHWKPSKALYSEGDLLLYYFAYDSLRSHDLGKDLLKHPPFNTHGLIWLSYPEDYAKIESKEEPNFSIWTKRLGSCIIEALHPIFASRWLEIEVAKGKIFDWKDMRSLGICQERVLNSFLNKIEETKRLDLGRFLLQAAKKIITSFSSKEHWIGNIKQQAQRIADRVETYHTAMTFLRQMERMQKWERNARSVGYFDEGYEASQLWKEDWEKFEGDKITENAQRIIAEVDPMRQQEKT